MDVLADGAWENIFKVKPEVFTAEEKRAWLDKNTNVALGSDAFFPFGDNIERAHRSGVAYVHSRVVPSVMTMLSKPVTNTIWQWHLPESVCSIIDQTRMISLLHSGQEKRFFVFPVFCCS